MLKTVSISNFQSHKQTELDFDPGVNVIIGASDAGKSAVFRAIYLALYNRPLGDGYISDWAKLTHIKLILDDCTIERIKGKENNKYILDDTVYKAFKHDPPEEILSAHNLDRNLNVQSQIDPFFLLQSPPYTPGEVSQHYNNIAGLSEIDKLNKNLASDERKLNSDLTQGKSYLNELEQELQQYDNLYEISEKIEQAEKLQNQINKKEQERSELIDLSHQISKSEERIEKQKHSIRAKDKVEQALQLKYKKQDLEQQVQEFHSIVNKINEKTEKISKMEKKLKQNKNRFHEQMPDICPLCGNQT